MNIDKLLEELNLSPEQYVQLKQLHTDYDDKMDHAFAYDCDGKTLWKALRSLTKAKEAEIKLLLNQGQLQRYTQIRQSEQQQIRQPQH